MSIFFDYYLKVKKGRGDEVILSIEYFEYKFTVSGRKYVCVCATDWSSPSWFIKWENLQLCSCRAHSGLLV